MIKSNEIFQELVKKAWKKWKNIVEVVEGTCVFCSIFNNCIRCPVDWFCHNLNNDLGKTDNKSEVIQKYKDIIIEAMNGDFDMKKLIDFKKEKYEHVSKSILFNIYRFTISGENYLIDLVRRADEIE